MEPFTISFIRNIEIKVEAVLLVCDSTIEVALILNKQYRY
jgi:hypothetical protein